MARSLALFRKMLLLLTNSSNCLIGVISSLFRLVITGSYFIIRSKVLCNVSSLSEEP